MLPIALEVEQDPEDPRQALPFLQLSVNGRTIRALLDSGAGRTSIAAPPGTVTWPADSTGTGAFGQLHRDQLWHATIAINGTDLATLDIADAPATGQFNIGQDLLSQFRCHFRLADHQLLLDTSESPSHVLENAESIYLDPARHVYLRAHWASGVAADVVFDTGASVTIIDASFADQHPELLTAQETSQGTDASGITQETPMVELEGPLILGHLFSSSPAAVVDLAAANATVPRAMNLILGWPLIAQADWIIDHPAASAWLVERP